MGDVHRLPSTDEVEREASAWFARLNADDVTADDRTRFEAWSCAHPCNAKAYAELSATWQELVKSGPLVRAVNFGQVMNAASAPPGPRRHWLGTAVAAGIGALVAGGAWRRSKKTERARLQTAEAESDAAARPYGP